MKNQLHQRVFIAGYFLMQALRIVNWRSFIIEQVFHILFLSLNLKENLSIRTLPNPGSVQQSQDELIIQPAEAF